MLIESASYLFSLVLLEKNNHICTNNWPCSKEPFEECKGNQRSLDILRVSSSLVLQFVGRKSKEDGEGMFFEDESWSTIFRAFAKRTRSGAVLDCIYL